MKTQTKVAIRFILTLALSIGIIMVTKTTLAAVWFFVTTGTFMVLFPWVIIFCFAVGFIVWPTLDSLPEYPSKLDL